METLLLVSRVLFSLIFITSGIKHFKNVDGMTAYTKSRGVPAPRIAVLGGGVLLLVGGIMLLTGFWVDLGAVLIFAFLLPTALLMHPYWRETDGIAKMNEEIAFLKDLALAGGALAIFALYQISAVSITHTALYGWPLFNS